MSCLISARTLSVMLAAALLPAANAYGDTRYVDDDTPFDGEGTSIRPSFAIFTPASLKISS
jgi:hypothetical protein